MVGRGFKKYDDIYRPVYLESESRLRISIGNIQIRCPICGSGLVGTNGTRKRSTGYVEEFQCKNPNCYWRKDHKYAKQFQLTSSYVFKKEIMLKMKSLYSDLFNGVKNTTIARMYNISPMEVTYLRKEFENSLKKRKSLDQLVEFKQHDKAIAIDETFLKIEGKTVYIIIATGYKSRKTLGVKVSTTRTAEDIREVFEEAEKNSQNQISIITLDAWGGTIDKDGKELNA